MTARHRLAGAALWGALAALPLLLLWPVLRQTIEGGMSLHRLLEFPALFRAGSAAQRLDLRAPGLHWIDWRGWTGACWVALVSIIWMLPFQRHAGIGLVLLAILLGAIAIRQATRSASSTAANTPPQRKIDGQLPQPEPLSEAR